MPNDVTVNVGGGQTVSVAVSGQTGPTATLVAGGTAIVTVMDGATAWADITGKPSTFAPSAHAASHGSGGTDAVTVAIGQVTGLQTALDAKATPADVTAAVAAVIDAAPAALNTLNELAAALGNDASFATTVTNALAAKAPIASPTFTGTVSGVTKAMVGLGNVDNTSDASKPISTATQAALDGKADTSDSRLTNAREWSAATIDQAEAEAGTGTTRRAFTAQRVFQAVAAWWAGSAAKTKLDGIATGATANATDAQLRDRSTHTGTQTASTISDFTAAVVAAAPPTTDASLLTSGTLPAARLPATTVSAGSYGSASAVGTFTVGADGRLTAAGSTAIAISAGAVSGLAAVATSGSASDLSAGTVPFARLPVGTSSTTVAAGNDSRLSDSRTPTAGSVTDASITSGGLSTSSLNWAAIQPWAASTNYAKGDLVSFQGIAYRRSAAGTSGATFNVANWQQITPTDFVASQIASGTIATARLGSGTASSSTFLRGDNTWATAGSSSASDLTSGTLGNSRLTTRARASMNLYLWSSFR